MDNESEYDARHAEEIDETLVEQKVIDEDEDAWDEMEDEEAEHVEG